MAEVDTSIYKQQPQTGINALNPSQIVDFASKATSLGSDLAVGNAIKNAADPSDPTGVNVERLQKGITENPLAARQLLPTMHAIQQLKQAGYAADQSGIDTLQKRWGLVDAVLYPLRAKKDLSRGDLYDAAANLMAHPEAQKLGLTLPVVMNSIKTMPTKPDELRPWLDRMHGQVLSARERLDAYSPQIQYTNRGGELVAMDVNPRSPTFGKEVAKPVPTNLPPTTQVVNPSGARQYIGEQGTVPGREQEVPTTPAVPGVPGSSGGPPAVSENPPGTEKSAAIMQDDLARARNFGQEMAPWQQALEKLNTLGKGGTGPGSKGRQEFQSFLFALAPDIARWSGVSPDKLQNYAEAEKYLTQATQSRAQGFGAHTDMQLATAISGNPNVNINQMANVDVVKMAIALRRMEQAQTLHSAKSGPVGYTESSAKWAGTQDPRAYAIDMMDAKQLKKLDETLKPGTPERRKFNASIKAAIDAGVISPIEAEGAK